MASNLFGGAFFGGYYFGAGGDVDVKTGTGGIDTVQKRKQIHLPYKPTGLLDRPAKKSVDVRIEETRQIHEEVSRQVAKEFTDPTPSVKTPVVLSEPLEMQQIQSMSQIQIEYEIGVLLRKKVRDEEEELMLLLMMIANL